MIIISVIYLPKRYLATILLIFVLFAALISVFHNQAFDSAEKVFSVFMADAKLRPIYAVETKEKKLAISFDAAWGATRTPILLNILDDYNIKTTFFLTNIWLRKYPQMAKEIVARGHEIGLHSANHPDFTKISEAKMLNELRENADMVTEITGKKAAIFRPPFGAYNNKVIKTIESQNIYPIQWSVDSLDWKDLSAEQIYKRVTEKTHPGAIVLFHNDGKNTPEALKKILEYFQAEGYRVVPVSQLIYKDNYYIDHRGYQIKKNN